MAKIFLMRFKRFASVSLGTLLPLLNSSLVIASVAKADIAVIVNPKNVSTWSGESRDEVKDIFLAKRQRFPDGSSAKPIDQQHGIVRQEFYQKIADKDESALNIYWSNLIFTG